jgi:hypothetical protein
MRYAIVIGRGCNRAVAQGGQIMSEVRPQLLITLVHGTWGRGFFPRRRRHNGRPFWFEEGSPFLGRLSTELGGIPHKIRPLLWSGANSIFVRDKTAQVLAEHLATEHAEHPQSTQLVIAHSHGGNIALVALHHLQKLDASQLDGADSANPLVVTLATPFIEIHRANFGPRPFYIRSALMLAMNFMLLFAVLLLLRPLFPDEYDFDFWAFNAIFAVVALTTVLLGWWWIYRRAPARQSQIDALNDATRLGEVVSAQAQRLLIIRAIDDEASLTLALGTISNYATARSISLVFLLLALLLLTNGIIALTRNISSISGFSGISGFLGWVGEVAAAVGAGFIVLTIMLFGMLVVSRLAHGRELAVSPMECQINTQSAPDAVDLSKIVTLVSCTYVKSLRHGIYDHEDCAKTISDWVRSHVCASPMR